MKLQVRIEALYQLGVYLLENDPAWKQVQAQATQANAWFTPGFLEHALSGIARQFLQKDKLEAWAQHYHIPGQQLHPKTVGITMAGNIPLVGFHDFLTIFLAGHRQRIKPSSKDNILIRHLVDKLAGWFPETAGFIQLDEMLKGCDAYIATGSNNTARYFSYYFGKYPHIIRRNRTSVAVLTGNETGAALRALADDIMLYFGLGCRNVSRLFVPEQYDFVPLLRQLDAYNWVKDHDKYRNNYDYQLSMLLLNHIPYMSNEALLLVENEALFSPISVVHYSYYKPSDNNPADVFLSDDIQCICGSGGNAFGQAQQPGLMDYADGVDTMAFALAL